MSVDGRFIKYLGIELNQDLTNGKVQKISQISNTDFLFNIRANSENKYLYLSLSTSVARIHLIEKPKEKFDAPGGFCMFLRKHIEGGVISQIQSLNNDRIFEITVSNVNDIGDLETYKMIIELFGRYANLIILDDKDKVLNAYKHIHPFDNVDRTIVNGITYEIPKDDKIDPEDLDKIKTFFSKDNLDHRDIINNIRGVSPLLAKAILKKANFIPTQLFDSYKNLMNMPIKPTLKEGKKQFFYFVDIFEDNQRYFDSLSLLLEHYYHEQTDKEKVKQIHKYLSNFAKNQVNKYRNKLEKLTKDLKNAQNNEIYRMKGDVLIQDQHKIKPTDYEYTGFSYELDKELTIDLDRRLTIIENANKFYKRYKKLKTAIKHLNKQIILTKHKLNYFISLKQQINNNYNLKDLKEIRVELIELKYFPKKKTKKQKKKQKLNYETFVDELDIMILVGKNNLQNNYLTHKHARKKDMWFHVQNQSGSHVIVQSKDLTESTIRNAANLAAYYSKSQKSSSVAVDYTLVKNIKKIPGELGSFVSYTNQKTIYIDPDISLIHNLKKL
ncbi:MAG: NFACT family protein [Tenericutes bacterium]|jgi:predicted ribosome quality control (RQC) complex YloA/Tae2 family protein|nr:NFACT family protein [Mycoplasmatota bacterium]